MFELLIEPCQPDNAEIISNLLEELGAVSVTLTDKYDDPILEPDIGSMPLWPHLVIQALFIEYEDAEAVKNTLSIAFPTMNFDVREVVEQNWERVCMDRFKATSFGQRLWICPSWDTPPDLMAANLILDPGLAFGTGTHPTTSLCLRWLDSADLSHAKIVDYGCGSGILGLAALILGAKHVTAIDIDEQALIATQNNATLNNIQASKLSIGYPDSLDTTVDLVIANILLSPLLQLQKRFKSLLNEQGLLVVSGVLVEQTNELIESYQVEFDYIETIIEQEWALIVFRAKQ